MPSCTCHDAQSLTRFVPAKGMGVPDESFGYLYDDIGNQNVGTVTDSYAYGPFGQCAAAGTTPSDSPASTSTRRPGSCATTIANAGGTAKDYFYRAHSKNGIWTFAPTEL